ncbi:Mss4-like protein [Mycena olivaceomarginata]|nr:Mss4-like protein [Mycena olivaceomarginata]
MSETSPRIEYRGNCHCGAFKFKLRVSELNEALSCNCSICSKNGYLWTFPERDQFTVVKGDESTTLKSYRFGKQTIMHKFCPTCGTSVMQARMPNCTDARIPIMGINIRTLEGVDVDSLKVNAFEGCMAEGAPHKVPEPVATGPVSEGSTAYHGNCHCGAVAYTLLAPQKISKVTWCNCSICSRDAALWTYPDTDTITFRGRESATEYTFSSRVAYHGFCKVCGVSVYERFDNSHDPRTALNVRTMHELDVATLEIRLFDGKAMPPVYSVWEP